MNMPCAIKNLKIVEILDDHLIPDIARLVLLYRYPSPYYDCATIVSKGENQKKIIIHDNSLLFKKNDYKIYYCISHHRLHKINT